MGAEYYGEAEKNVDELWIDPYEYKEELANAVWMLHRSGMRVSIYNIPLCLLCEKAREFARDSISAWKKVFQPCCGECRVKNNCSGVFATACKQSAYVAPISLAEPCVQFWES